jgi:hypothetical protein
MAIEDITKAYGLVPTTPSTGTLGLEAPSPAARFGSKISGNLIKMGGYDPMALPYSQRNKARNEGLRALAERLYGISAKLSGDPAKMALYQEMQKAKQPKAGSTTFERFGVYDEQGNLVGSVLKSSLAEIQQFQNAGYTIGTLGTGSSGGQPKIYQVIDAGDNRVPNGIVTYEEFIEGQKSGKFGPGSTIVNIPTGTESPGLEKISLFSEENKPFADRWQTTDTLLNNLQNYSNSLAKMEDSALTGLGSVANFTNSLIQGFLKVASDETKDFYNNSKSDNTFITLEGTNFEQRVKDISNQYSINESQVRDLAYLFAAARGQEGRGLSDRDYENALNIVSGGVGKEGKIKVVEDVYGRLSNEVSRIVNKRINILEDQRQFYPERQRYFDINIGQLRSLQNATPFSPFVNPLEVPNQTNGSQTTDPIDALLEKYE